MINEVCNLKCPYCFANEFVNVKQTDHLTHNNITLENFDKAVKFALTEENPRIGIIGGEPTLHPQFKEIMERLICDDSITDVVVFTNATYIEKYFKLLTHKKIFMLINCNSPSDMGQAQFDKMVENLDTAINEYYMKDKITLGINMYKPGFEYDYILKLLDKYGLAHVRTSITVPNTEDKKEFDVLEYFRSMKESVFKFFRELEKRGIMPTYDCNYMPTCVPTQEEMKWLEKFWDLEDKSKRRCNITDCSKCSPVIDILPDLNAVRCFGMSREHKVPISKFGNIAELRDYYLNYFDSFAYNIYSSEKCKTCEQREKMQCMGGCLAFKANKIRNARQYFDTL
jgi:sulfatase maturation enzyme AslB (radical SAM superfamily)